MDSSRGSSYADLTFKGRSAEADNLQIRKLKTEFAGLQEMNGAMENLISALDKGHENLEQLHRSTIQADKLMDIWINMVDEMHRSQNLLLNGWWSGLTQDEEDAQRMEEIRLQKKREMDEALKKKESMEVASKAVATSRLSNLSTPRLRGSVRGRGARTGMIRTSSSENRAKLQAAQINKSVTSISATTQKSSTPALMGKVRSNPSRLNKTTTSSLYNNHRNI